MVRYFLEIAYKGTNYAGFQIQQNANTVQAELEKAMQIYFRNKIELTGSSRTDAGVHANQNYLHFDVENNINDIEKTLYHLNAILPLDIVVKNIHEVNINNHCRFDAISRNYEYTICTNKNPFVLDSSYYYPYSLNIDALNECATMLKEFTSFESFAKKNTQVFTHNCTILNSIWKLENNILTYNVTGNRFLRGMVRGLVGTMLLVGRGKYAVKDFKKILESKSISKTDFSAPAKGLVLMEVKYKYIN
ncbi:MAG: tRNA pseudouridine(38-40) synthase TruA [Ferruginibacter sp.]|nr:tRNA pseudouridine(38-40) synthase TruA [Ferruginibacter sp.]